MMIEYISIVDILKDERGKNEYIYEAFSCNDYEYLIFYIYYKYLFNIDPNYLRIQITTTLIQKMIKEEMVYNIQKYE